MKRKDKPAGDAAPTPPRQHGLPAHVPSVKTKKKVRLCASLGFNQEEIALMIDVSESTLKKHYVNELRVGGLEADLQVMKNLYKMATSDGPGAGSAAMFWAKVRRRWHEVQRVIHGYDPETIKAFVKGVVGMLKRDIPDACPGCQTKLNLTPKIAAQLYELSQQMAAKLPQSEVVPMPRPALASDGIEKVD